MVFENFEPPSRPIWWEKILKQSPIWRWLILLTIFVLALIYSVVLLPPADFPTKKPIVIKSDTSVSKAAQILEDTRSIHYSFVYINAVKIFSVGKGIQAGTYYFDRPINVLRLAWRTTVGHFGLEKIKVIIPEGATSFQIAQQLEKILPEFNKQEFLRLAETKEGFLFPDTYYFLPYTPPDELLKIMTNNFNRAIGPYRALVAARGRELKEVITMASIVEREAADLEDRKLIAGILWNRIREGMPLQVDAAFTYYLNRNTFELTQDDLKSDSPYNTYKNKGLPPSPIGSPSLDAIGATLFPTESNYFYYLADKKGKTYYAETFDGHKKNRIKYLN